MAPGSHGRCAGLLAVGLTMILNPVQAKDALDNTSKPDDMKEVMVPEVRRLRGTKSPSSPQLRAHVTPVRIENGTSSRTQGHVRTALCFSGGGSRAGSAALGYYRALVHMGILPDRVDAISSVSGGSWASSQYMFADISNVELLGKPTTPEMLSMAYLESTKPAMALTMNTSTNNIFKNLLVGTARCKLRTVGSNRELPDKKTCLQESASSAWIKAIGKTFLAPYGADGNKYMAASDLSRKEALDLNPGLPKSRRKWVIPVSGRPPTFIIGGTLLAPLNYASGVQSAVSLQMSPDTVGSPYYPDQKMVTFSSADNGANTTTLLVGGGLVDSFAFGTSAPLSGQSGGEAIFSTLPAKPFSLQDAVGISSAAFGAQLAKLNKLQWLDPQGLYWPVTATSKQQQKASNFLFGDGGNLENSGLLAVLQRRVSKAAVFFSSYTGINSTVSPTRNLCDVPYGTDLSNALTIDFSCLFGYCTGGDSGGWFYGSIQVFEKHDYSALLCKFQELKAAGKPMVYKQILHTVANTWWGIPRGHMVEVLWSYLEEVKDFEDRLPEDTRDEVKKDEHGSFVNFPLYKTTFQNPPQTTSMTLPQINLLAGQTEYAVNTNHALFSSFFE